MAQLQNINRIQPTKTQSAFYERALDSLNSARTNEGMRLMELSARSNDPRALEWLTKEACCDKKRPLEILTQLVREGNTCAIPAIEKCANNGYTDAMCTLGFIYENGIGVERSECIAAEWYSKILTKESKVDVLLRNIDVSDPIVSKLIYEMSLAGHTNIRNALEHLAETNAPDAMNIMGSIYICEHDMNAAFNMLQKAASLGYKPTIFFNQPDTHSEYDVNLIESAIAGDPDAISVLKKEAPRMKTVPNQIIQSAMYGNHGAISILEKHANRWADNWDKDAAILMGLLYEHGVGVEQSDERAHDWYSRFPTRKPIKKSTNKSTDKDKTPKPPNARPPSDINWNEISW